MLSHERIWAAIDALAERHALSASGLARKAGLDSTAFNKSKRTSADGRPRWPSTESLAKIFDATGASIEDFMRLLASSRDDRRGVSVPLLGFAQAGMGGFFVDAGFPEGQGLDLVDLPVAASASAFAVKVSGDSMLPLYREGDVLVVERDATIRRGDRVVVKTLDGEVMAKIMEKRTAARIELRSLNLEHPDRVIDSSRIEWIARIVWASQ
ncbi:MAG: helix-turn-helix transcriptional regulator [Phyllobacteriaceae bacterium]|nr:helix-turn-helix transcriptional regulator [Phyllobacteriaceae bacterium]